MIDNTKRLMFFIPPLSFRYACRIAFAYCDRKMLLPTSLPRLLRPVPQPKEALQAVERHAESMLLWSHSVRHIAALDSSAKLACSTQPAGSSLRL